MRIPPVFSPKYFVMSRTERPASGRSGGGKLVWARLIGGASGENRPWWARGATIVAVTGGSVRAVAQWIDRAAIGARILAAAGPRTRDLESAAIAGRAGGRLGGRAERNLDILKSKHDISRVYTPTFRLTACPPIRLTQADTLPSETDSSSAQRRSWFRGRDRCK